MIDEKISQVAILKKIIAYYECNIHHIDSIGKRIRTLTDFNDKEGKIRAWGINISHFYQMKFSKRYYSYYK